MPHILYIHSDEVLPACVSVRNREMEVLLCICLCSVVLYTHSRQGNKESDKKHVLVQVNPIINVHAHKAVLISHSHSRGC